MPLILSILLALTTATTSRDAVRRLQPAELHELMKNEEAIALDVRGTVPYKYGHIAGAVWIPLGHVDQRAVELPEDKLIVAYCTCKSEEISLDAAVRLSQLGFKNVAVLQGGYPAWVKAGLPTKSLAEPATAPVETPSAAGAPTGRLAPPAAVKCDRNGLTSYAGLVTVYERGSDRVKLTIATSAGTTESVSARHADFLIEAQPFTAADWKRIEEREGVLRPKTSVIAWVCADGAVVLDWRPDTVFTGGE